jgi:hypothetical protein
MSMRGGRHSERAPVPAGRRPLAAAVALLCAAVVLAAGLAHLIHEHPHRGGQELSCVVCQTPIGAAPTAPTVAPPAVRPAAPPAVTPAAPPVARAPLSFSPKQSPPSA